MNTQFAAKFVEDVRAAAPANTNRSVLEQVYSSITQMDFDTFRLHLAPDAELEIRGFQHLDGAWKGRDQVAEAARRNFAQVADQKPVVERMAETGDSIIVMFREEGVHRGDGLRYALRGVQWFTFTNGLISRIDQIVATI